MTLSQIVVAFLEQGSFAKLVASSLVSVVSRSIESLFAFDEHNGPNVVVSTLEDVIDHGDQEHPTKHRGRPIPTPNDQSYTPKNGEEGLHGFCGDRIIQRPCVEEQHWCSSTKCEDVNYQTLAWAQRPASGGQWLSEQATPDQASNRDVVREQDRDSSEGVESIQGSIGPFGCVCQYKGTSTMVSWSPQKRPTKIDERQRRRDNRRNNDCMYRDIPGERNFFEP